MPISRRDVLTYLLIQVAVLLVLVVPAADQGTELYFGVYFMEILSLTWLLPEARDWRCAENGRDKACRALLFFICIVQILVPLILFESSLAGGDELRDVALVAITLASVVALLVVALLGNYEEAC
ncbi:MAG: hypothetical protein Q4A43_05800 [Coriobacteriia bacterium]|nr:hypothetical protein [Coriobacteriia bacterium]